MRAMNINASIFDMRRSRLSGGIAIPTSDDTPQRQAPSRVRTVGCDVSRNYDFGEILVCSFLLRFEQ